MHKSVFYFCPEFCRTDISVAAKGEGEKNFCFYRKSGKKIHFCCIFFPLGQHLNDKTNLSIRISLTRQGMSIASITCFGVFLQSFLYFKSFTDFLIIFSNLRKCRKGLEYQAFPAFCISEDTPHIMAYRSLIWRSKVVKA